VGARDVSPKETAVAETTKQHKGSQAKKWKRVAKGNGKKACTVEGCKRPYRAKGYCFFHYQQWRKGELAHSRYEPCRAEKCTKRPFKDFLCEQHYNEKMGIKPEAPAAPAA
jgi:hypothetical protein